MPKLLNVVGSSGTDHHTTTCPRVQGVIRSFYLKIMAQKKQPTLADNVCRIAGQAAGPKPTHTSDDLTLAGPDKNEGDAPLPWPPRARDHRSRGRAACQENGSPLVYCGRKSLAAAVCLQPQAPCGNSPPSCIFSIRGIGCSSSAAAGTAGCPTRRCS